MLVKDLIYRAIKVSINKLKDNPIISSIVFDEQNFRLGCTVTGYPSDLERKITFCAYVGDATIDILYEKSDPYGKTSDNMTFNLRTFNVNFLYDLIKPWYK